MARHHSSTRPPPDPELVAIADYVCDYLVDSEEAVITARYCLMDALGCAIAALRQAECRRHLGPVVPGATLPGGARVPGTAYELDPIHAAYNIGCMVRWLDYNDTWLAAEWGHPSDNLGAILAVADYVSRGHDARARSPLTMRDVLVALIKAYEIQGVLALENSFNRIGIDHVILVKIASSAVTTALLGGGKDVIINALSNAWLDGGTLRSYRHAPNTGWRKSWAAGDASARAVRLALQACNGEMGYPSVLSTPEWGYYDVFLDGEPLRLPRPYGSYVVENILFKVAFPAEFHAQTAVEAALQLHLEVKDRLAQVDHIVITTQAPAMRIINKTGPLHNPADRDHCLQYAVAIALLFGELTSHHYSDEIASDTRIDALREKMRVVEEPRYSRDYLDAEKRAIANQVTIHYLDGAVASREVAYPLGHRRRRSEAWPLLVEKFERNLSGCYAEHERQALGDLLLDDSRLLAMSVAEFMARWVRATPPSGGPRS